MAKTRLDKDKEKDHEEDFKNRNNVIEEEMKDIGRRIDLIDAEGENSYPLREELSEKEKQLKNLLNEWKEWKNIQTKANKGIKEMEKPIVIGEEEMEQLIEAANEKEQQNKITQENEQKNINLTDDYSNDDLYGDNGINDHEKELYGGSEEKVKSYMSALVLDDSVTNKEEKEEKMIRLRFNFNPDRTSMNAPAMAAANRALLNNLINCVNKVDKKAKIKTWKGPGGRGMQKENIETMDTSRMEEHLDQTETGVNWYESGKMVYKMGLRVATNVPIHVFLMRWQDFRKNDIRKWVPVYQSESQKYAKVYQVGFCLGSTEGQNVELLNSRIEKEMDNTQIEMSFQSINQAKVVSEYWKKANDKAKAYKGTSSFNRVKFQWAPKALIVYAANADEVPALRKGLMVKYGKNTEEGVLPVWPDGSSMKFCPLKGKAFNDIGVQKKVFERVGTHVWIKAQTTELELELKNLQSTKQDLKGKTIMEAVLALTIPMDKKQFRPFLHVSRMWTRDENEDKWGVVVHSKLRNVAMKVLNALKDKLFSEYGDAVKKYFKDEKRGYLESYSANAAFEEESWFNFEEESVDDIIGGQAKILLAEGFKDFINNDKTIGGKRSRPTEDPSIPTVFFSGGSDMDTVSETTTIKDAVETNMHQTKRHNNGILRNSQTHYLGEDENEVMEDTQNQKTKKKNQKKGEKSNDKTGEYSDSSVDSESSDAVSVQWSDNLDKQKLTTTVRIRLKNIRKALKKRGIKRKVRYNIVNANDNRTNQTLKALVSVNKHYCGEAMCIEVILGFLAKHDYEKGRDKLLDKN